jgi:Ca2+/H+ antiporter
LVWGAHSATIDAVKLSGENRVFAILGLMVLVFNYIAHDGESNWLEGLQLVVLYAMAAIVLFFLPAAAFSG